MFEECHSLFFVFVFETSPSTSGHMVPVGHKCMWLSNSIWPHCTAGWLVPPLYWWVVPHTKLGNFDHHLWVVPLVPPDQGTSRAAPSWAISRVFQQKDFDTQIWIINWFNEAYFHQWNCHICVIRQMPRSKLICSGKSSPISSSTSSSSSGRWGRPCGAVDRQIEFATARRLLLCPL